MSTRITWQFLAKEYDPNNISFNNKEKNTRAEQQNQNNFFFFAKCESFLQNGIYGHMCLKWSLLQIIWGQKLKVLKRGKKWIVSFMRN